MESKGKILTAIAGVVVGVGATIFGAKVLSDRKNQKKISEVIAKGKSLARNYADKTVKVGRKKAKKLIKVVKTAEKGVKNI